MSHKRAKRIRRAIGYHPKEEHPYLKSKTGQIFVHPDSKRALYLAMKRDK
jgi:hypothetical protein